MTSLRILVIEDDPMVGELLAETLLSMGHRICGIERTSAGAIEAARVHQPDLMIVDVNLAGGSGTSAVARIIADRPVPHIFISGRPLQSGQLDAELLLKPFRLSQLALAIDRAGTWANDRSNAAAGLT